MAAGQEGPGHRPHAQLRRHHIRLGLGERFSLAYLYHRFGIQAARPEASPEVRATTMGELERLRRNLKVVRSADRAAEAHLRLAGHDLGDFLDEPQSGRPRPPRVPAPPGRPIG